MKTATISGLVLMTAVAASAAPSKSKSKTTTAPAEPTTEGTTTTGKSSTGVGQAAATPSTANTGAGDAKDGAPGNKGGTRKACPNFKFTGQQPMLSDKNAAGGSSATPTKQDSSQGSSHGDDSQPTGSTALKSTSSGSKPPHAEAATTAPVAGAKPSTTSGEPSPNPPGHNQQHKRWMIPDDLMTDITVTEGYGDSYKVIAAEHTTLDVSSISSMAAAVSRLTAGMNHDDIQTLANHPLFGGYLTTSTSTSFASATPTTLMYQYDDEGLDIHIDNDPSTNADRGMATANKPDATTIIVGQHTELEEHGRMPSFESTTAATSIEDPGDMYMAFYQTAHPLAKRAPIPHPRHGGSNHDDPSTTSSSSAETPAAVAPDPSEPVVPTSPPAPAAPATDPASPSPADPSPTPASATATATASASTTANALVALAVPFTGTTSPAVTPEAGAPTLAPGTEAVPGADTAVAAAVTGPPALNPSSGLAIGTGTGLAIGSGTASGGTGLGVKARNTGSHIDVHPRQTAAPVYGEARLRRWAAAIGVDDNAFATTVVTKRNPTTMLTMPSVKRHANTA